MSTKVNRVKYGTKQLAENFGEISIAKLLKNYRNTEDLLQKDLAEMLHISPQRLNDFEKGRRLPDLESVIFFANQLGDSEAFFIQVLFQDYLRQQGVSLKVSVK